MAKKQDLIDKLETLGIELTGKETIPELEVLLKENDKIEEGDEDARDIDEEDADRLEPGPERVSVAKDDGDYLRKYQYKKVNDKPAIGGVLTDPDKGSKAERMKNHLLVQPRVRILVPRAPGEHGEVLMTVNLNGYRLDFPKNTYIELPEQVAQVIMDSQKQTDVALQSFRIDSDKAKTEALS